MLYFVATPIGNLEDISKRALRVLKLSSLIICEDTRVTKKLFTLLEDKFQIDLKNKKFISLHSHNAQKRIEQLDKSLLKENTVSYLSDAGMPAISDPGCELVKFCQENNIDYEVLPGANALLLAYASSGFCESKFSFFGFLPHKGKQREEELNKVLNSPLNSVLYESPHRLLKLLKEISKKDPNRELFLIKEATKMYESKFKNKALTLYEELKDKTIKGEWAVVVKRAENISKGEITKDDILKLNIPKKEKAKLLSKISNLSIKECYNLLLKNDKSEN